MFVLGFHLILAIDHKPLVPIFNDCSPNEIKYPRILDIREQALMYRFKAISVPGNTNEGYGMSHIPVPIAKLTSVESTDLEEAIEEGIQYQYTRRHLPSNSHTQSGK